MAAIPVGDDAWLVAASTGGAPDNPAWFHNVLAHPDVERDAGWARFTPRSEGFRSYEERTTRTIPVLRLTRRDG